MNTSQHTPAVEIRHSAEVRWFFKEEPKNVTEWFGRNFKVTAEPARLDCYLNIPKVGFAGIKLREYRSGDAAQGKSLNLEIKMLDSAEGLVVLGDGIAGKVEQWRKWTMPICYGVDEYIAATGGRWAYVEKHRKLASFEVGDRGVELLLKKTRVDQGCGLEITELKIGGATELLAGGGVTWWSLGFEAFSTLTDADQKEVLERAARYVIKTFGLPTFHMDHSCSYPEWLASF